MATVIAGKYELQEVLHDQGIRSYRARHITLGHALMVHFIPGSQRGDDFALLERLAQLPESARKLFFDAGEHNAVPYVVSWPLQEFDNLPGWLSRTIEKNRRLSKPAGAGPKTQATDSSEFTRQFFKDIKEPAASGAGGLVTGQSTAPPKVKEPPSPPKEPGEFTRFFQVPPNAPVPTKPVADPPPAPRKETAPPPLSSGPGEFTQFFRGAPAEPHPATAAQTEFPPAPPLFPPADRSPARPPETAAVPPLAPQPALPKPPLAAPNAIPAPGAAIPAVPKPPVAAVPPEPLVADDYAKIIARPPAPALPPTPPIAARKPAVALPSVPQVQRPAPSAYLPMWITLAVLFVLAVGLTLFLALTH